MTCIYSFSSDFWAPFCTWNSKVNYFICSIKKTWLFFSQAVFIDKHVDPVHFKHICTFKKECTHYKSFYDRVLFAVESRIRLFTATEVDWTFWPVIKCLSMTTCMASSWLARKPKRNTIKIKEKAKHSYRIPIMTLKWGAAYLYMSHHCLSQSPPLSRAGWQSLGSAPAQTLMASGKAKYKYVTIP